MHYLPTQPPETSQGFFSRPDSTEISKHATYILSNSMALKLFSQQALVSSVDKMDSTQFLLFGILSQSLNSFLFCAQLGVLDPYYLLPRYPLGNALCPVTHWCHASKTFDSFTVPFLSLKGNLKTQAIFSLHYELDCSYWSNGSSILRFSICDL